MKLRKEKWKFSINILKLFSGEENIQLSLWKCFLGYNLPTIRDMYYYQHGQQDLRCG